MNVSDLFHGVSVVIDDEVNDPTANLRNILTQIKNQNIPVLAYDAIPSEAIVSHFQNLSFVLLDWRLTKKNISNGISLPHTLQTHEVSVNVDFIKKLKEVCFCPVFIFTNEDKNEIIATLETEGLYKKTKPNHIFIKSKAEIKGRTKLFAEIRKWIKGNPSIYVLKEWEREYQKSKNKLFLDFHALSPVWPRIMWRNFEDDGVNKSFGLGELISRNLHTRMAPFEFSEKILNKKKIKRDNKNEIMRVLEGERYLKNSCLHTNAISTGDIFKIVDEEGNVRYFLNIRAQCDLVRGSSLDKVELYCLKGKVITKKEIKIKGVSFKDGHFNEKVHHAIISFIDDGHILEFSFRNLIIKKWKELKDKRIGQLLPPYINQIQQRYALFLQRQGLPRIPEIALSGK